DAGGAVRLHFLLAGARDFPPWRRHLGIRAGGGGRSAADRMATRARLITTTHHRTPGDTEMKTITRLVLTACLALPVLAACKKEEAVVATVAAPLTAPTTADDGAWRDYVSDVVTRNMEGIANQPYVYYLPASTGDEDADAGSYGRLQDKASSDVARGIVRGNMLAYASSDSSKMADIVVQAFADVSP